MSIETFIGWRYLKSKRKQKFISVITLMSLFGTALGVTALIVVLAVMNGFQEDLKEKILGVNSHIVVLKSEAPMDDYRVLTPKLLEIDGVESVAPFVYSQGMISTLGGISGLVIRGVDVFDADQFDNLKTIVKSGHAEKLKEKKENRHAALVGSEMARQLGLLAGDIVKFVSPMGRVTPLGGRAPLTREFIVAGVFESGMYEYDSNMAYISLEAAQDFLNLNHSVTGLEVKVHDIYNADDIKMTILERLGHGFWAKDWMEMNKNLFSALKLEKTAMFIILILTVLVAAFNIIATLIMVVMEKTRDIAVLKAMGATGRMVMNVFVFQGVFIGAVGTLIGLGGGLVLCELLSKYQFVKLPENVYYMSTLPVMTDSADVIIISLAAIAISFTATLYPAWQAGRLRPVEALRYE